MPNKWIQDNKSKLSQLKNFLTECEYKPEFYNFPLVLIRKLLAGAEAEINKLQQENELLKSNIKKFESEK